MMDKDYVALKIEDAKPKYSGLSDQERCDLMNAPGSGKPICGAVQIVDLKRWMAKQVPDSLISVLRYYAANGSDVSAKKAAAGLLELFDENVDKMDMHNGKAQAGLTALVSAGVITQSQKDEATALGDTPQTIANNCGFAVVYPGHLQHARTL